MSAYSSATEVNTNISDINIGEPVDLGREFLSKPSSVETSVPNVVNQFGCKGFGQPFITCEGYLSMHLLNDIRVDINSNHSISVSTPEHKVSVSHSGHNIGVFHPFGRIFAELLPYNNCHIETGIHLAKMSGRGVTFTSLNRSLIYLVDTSGCKTTTERFRKLNYDFTADIFHSNTLTGDYARQRTFNDLLSYEVTEDGNDKIWYLSGLRIRQNLLTGDLMITKSYGKVVIYLCPKQSQVKVNAPNLKILVNDNPECYLQVIKPHSRDEQRVTVGSTHFRVRYGSQKAGFDGNDQLVLM